MSPEKQGVNLKPMALKNILLLMHIQKLGLQQDDKT